MDWKTCKHEWEAVPKHSGFGIVHQDECLHCGSIGILAEMPNERGFYEIIAQPWGEVIYLDEYRKRKVEKDVETKKIASE
jgi:hypothetical protein